MGVIFTWSLDLGWRVVGICSADSSSWQNWPKGEDILYLHRLQGKSTPGPYNSKAGQISVPVSRATTVSRETRSRSTGATVESNGLLWLRISPEKETFGAGKSKYKCRWHCAGYNNFESPVNYHGVNNEIILILNNSDTGIQKLGLQSMLD